MNDQRNVLVLGGTGWVGGEIARQACSRGARVTCLARGVTGAPPAGATFIPSDRGRPDAYQAVAGQEWDEVIELSWQPRFVRGAVAVLAGSARHWTYISSCSVYARQDLPLASEAADPHAPLDADEADAPEYGPAKAACEALSVAALGDRLLRVRPGLIGGPGDPTGRSTYWVTRAALAPTRPMLAPEPAGAPTQIIDVRDLVAWLLAAGADGLTGAFNAVGPTMALADWIALSRLVGRHRSSIEWADPELLLASGVEQFAGDRLLPLWIAEPSLRCFFLRDGSAAERHGLRHRSRVQMLTDALVRAGAHEPAAPGPALTLEQEQGILQQLAVWRERGADDVLSGSTA